MFLIMIIIVDNQSVIALMSHKERPFTPPDPAPASPSAIHPDDRRISSEALLGDRARIVIEHQGQAYLLRQTHAGKLILTK